ncbi:MAG: hypothetical protein Q8N16_03740 [bacterium]|nr:hypothetical protein [bacterium]
MKNSLFKKVSLSTKVSLLALVLFGLAIPLSQGQAYFGVLAAAIGGSILAMSLQFFVGVSLVVVLFANLLFQLVSSPYFITLPYTSGGIVAPGWAITRDLANMGFIFALVVIGLATALRLGEYHAKKTLPLLIAMILLVNFTPAICGLIVDAANIVMNFFIEGVSSFDTLVEISVSQYAALKNSFTSLPGYLTGHIDIIFRSMAMGFFNTVTALFLVLYSFLFIMRYVAIWILVILSPLAFFANVLPTTRKYFSAWWNQFLQWSFVGVSAAFFLYLAEQLLVLVDTDPTIPPIPAGISALTLGLLPVIDFNTIMRYVVVQALLAFGFFGSLSSGAIGASAIMSTAKRFGPSAARGVQGLAMKGIKKGTAKGKEVIGRGTERLKREILSTKTATSIIEGAEKADFGKSLPGKGLTWLAKRGALEAKKQKADVPTQIDKIMEDKTLNQLVDQEDYTGAKLLVNQGRFLPLERDLWAAGATALISKKKGEAGLFKPGDAALEELRKKGLTAQAKYSRRHLRETTSDVIQLSREKVVWDTFLDPSKKEHKDEMDSVLKEFRELSTKAVANQTDDEKATVAYLDKEFSGWRTTRLADLSQTIDQVITAGKTDPLYQAIAQTWSLDRTVKGLDQEAIRQLSGESADDPLILSKIARFRGSSHIKAFYEKFGPERGGKLAAWVEGNGSWNMAKRNSQVLRDTINHNQDMYGFQVAKDQNNQPFVNENMQPVLLNDRGKLNEYVNFANGKIAKPDWLHTITTCPFCGGTTPSGIPCPRCGAGGPPYVPPPPTPPPPVVPPVAPPTPVSGATTGYVTTPSGLAVPAVPSGIKPIKTPTGGKFVSGTPPIPPIGTQPPTSPQPPATGPSSFSPATNDPRQQLDPHSLKPGVEVAGTVKGATTLKWEDGTNSPYERYPSPMSGQERIRAKDEKAPPMFLKDTTRQGRPIRVKYDAGIVRKDTDTLDIKDRIRGGRYRIEKGVLRRLA